METYSLPVLIGCLMINLDTHVLINALAGKLRANEFYALQTQPWAISGIVLWELAKLIQLGRLTLDLRSASFENALSKIKVIPISVEIASTSCQLDFMSDPADELIAATSIVHRMPLLTRDKRIRTSKIVEFV